MRLPRGTCSVCGSTVPIRVNGAAREHISDASYRAAAGIRLTGHAKRIRTCTGSGKPVRLEQ